jgi:hypothetical protein
MESCVRVFGIHGWITIRGESKMHTKTHFIRLQTGILAAWILMAGSMSTAVAAVKYVSPAGASPYNGNDWSSAYSNLQDAITACLGESSTINVQTGRYALVAPLVIGGATNLTFRGGFTGSGLTTTTNAPTTIFRASGDIRLLAATNSTLTFDSLTFTNGFARENPTRGFTIRLNNCVSTFTNCVIRDNQSNGSADGGQYGTGIYAEKGALTLRDCLFMNNLDGEGNSQYGGAVYAAGVAVTSVNSRFIGNTLQGNAAYGGGFYLASCTNAWIEGCSFVSNTVYRMGAQGSGGGILASASPNLVITNCTFEYGNSDLRGSAITLTGNGQTTRISDCVIRNQFFLFTTGYVLGTEDVYINTTSSVRFENTILANSGTHGIYMDVNGSLVMTNCLFAAQPGHGIWATTGSVSLVNCTIADAGGWGVTNGGGTVTILDSILWGNALGSVPTNRLTMNNTCAQADYSSSGANNLSSDPLFFGGYYLSLGGLPTQTANSPCRDIGSVTAATRGLNALTTRTDGTADDGASAVDLGYHYPAAFTGNLANRVLYVDAVNGNDVNDGWASGSGALKTLTAALGRAIDHSTIYISTGKYNTALGEVFPLTIQDNNISLIGTNRAATVIDAGGSAVSRRGLLSLSRGRLWIEGLSITNGYTSAAGTSARQADGAGLHVLSCQTVITNCIVFNNRIHTTTDQNANGQGIYVAQGVLTIADSVVDSNQNAITHIRSGSGLYARDTQVTLKNTIFQKNTLGGNNACYGGAVYLFRGSAWIEGCTFATNGMTVNNGSHLGGAIYATTTAPLVLTNCTFTGNGVMTGAGSALALTGAGLRATILNCRIQNNTPAGNGGRDVDLNAAGYVLFKDTVIASGAALGIQQAGAASVLAMTNCLVNNQPGHGIYVASGTTYVQNVTSAGHTGWGLTNASGNVTIRDSIFWNNSVGGIRNNTGTLTVNYTTSQEIQTGTSNQVDNPLFTAGFYLGDGSPCINAGSANASVYGLDTRSTRVDGTPDSGIVDLGYHYAADSGGDDISNAVLYVSVNTGNNTNNGWSWSAPLKTLTAALGKAIDGSIIHIASGTYNTNSGEAFPLVLADNNLTFRGTNRADTIVDGSGSNRIFEATSKGILRFEHLTVTNGYAYNKVGAGFYLSGCQTTITNCTIVRNRLNAGAEYLGDKGGGIFAQNGTLTLVDCDVAGQYNTDGYYKFGSGLYATNVVLTVRNVSFQRNSLATSNPSFGAGVYMGGGSAIFTDCLFATNSTDYGGGLYANGVSPLILSNCTFVGNVATRGYNGGALYLSGGEVTASKCDIRRNTNSAGAATVYLDASGAASFSHSTLANNSGVGFFRTGSGALNLTNCLIFAQSNDAMRVATGTVSISSSTFANNLGWGVTNTAGTVTVKNSVVWGNTSGGITNATVSYTDSQEVNAGTGNLNTDPRFKDAAVFDFSLKPGSPCVNEGDNEVWMETGVDLAGAKRRFEAYVDMGAFESRGARGSILSIR